ncbi:hypothetical protein GCM10011297_29920 [Bacterioplanes sanyensis]|uniref:hypothetical protein n=1 Tax=Bacterioplanes sanyensis TaxID=1249553 RepID=UPI00167477CC|nr:hypothetical protein [Bacterioplanes sanyensis]GGY55059.1 hypothetical protein GCM10011297_29920 [Bacterioplanes sanyensis]
MSQKVKKVGKNRKVSYYFPHLFVDGEVKLPVGSLTPFKEQSEELKIRHSEFCGGSVFAVNGKLEVDEFDQETDWLVQKITELMKFSYFAKSVPQSMDINGFVSLETFDMFRLIENNVDKSFEHKIVISNGMSDFSHSADKVLLSRKNQAVNSICVHEEDFGFDIVGTHDILESKSDLYSVIHLYNKVWEQQSLFNSFLDKPILAKTTFEVLYKLNGGNKKNLKTFAFDFVEMIYKFVDDHKDDEVISKILKVIKPYNSAIISNINYSLNNLKITRDSLVHDGAQNFDTSPIKFYMVWFPVYWSLTINRESLTRKHAIRFLCFLCLCKHLPSTWNKIDIGDNPPFQPKHSHLATYIMKSNILARDMSEEDRSLYIKVLENWLKEN